MHLSLILGKKHDADDFQVVSGPGNPILMNEEFNDLSEGDGNGYSEIHLHEVVSSGGRKSQRFAKPQEDTVEKHREDTARRRNRGRHSEASLPD